MKIGWLPRGSRERRLFFDIVWLIVFPPYGLLRMWKTDRRWHIAIKIAVTALFAAGVIVLIRLPMPKHFSGGRVVINDEEREPYGPELPAFYDSTLYVAADQSDEDLIAEVTQSDVTYVYASGSEKSTFYHRSDCKYAFASSKRLTLYEAYMLGYTTPCSLCDPPIYGQETVTEEEGETPEN